MLLLSVAVAVAALVLPPRTTDDAAATSVAVAPPVAGVVVPASIELAQPPPPAPPQPPPARPVRLRIPALGVRAPVVPLRTQGDVLTPPSDVREVGWWSGGRRPGSRVGHVLITGHTVHTGGGIFDNLADLRPGERVVVDTHQGAVRYRVLAVRYLTVRALAARSGALFARDGAPRLVLVTCAAWDGTTYHGNTVVVAAPEPSSVVRRATVRPRYEPPPPVRSRSSPAPALPSWYPCSTCGPLADRFSR